MTGHSGGGPHGTADEYARLQRCFLDHRKAPFRFRDQMVRMKQTLYSIQPNGLVHQPGLIAAPLPLTDINLDETEDSSHLSSTFGETEPPTAPFFLGFRGLKQLYLPKEPILVGYDLEKEVQEYHKSIRSKRSCELSLEWLPLSLVDIEKDEGLPLPSTSLRWQRLACRELDFEIVGVSEEAMTIAQFAQGEHDETACFDLAEEEFKINWMRMYPEPVSPPMSPTSETGTFFVPSPGVAVIDLTSESSSPVLSSVAQLQDDFISGCLDSEPVAPSNTPSSVSPDMLNFPRGGLNTSALMLDIPMVGTNSSDVDERVISFDVGFLSELSTQDPTAQPEDHEGFFDDALLEILKDRQYQAVKILEEERLNVLDLTLRLKVPSLSSELPAPEWSGHLSSPEVQFSWLRRTFRTAYEIPAESSLFQLGISLKWTPVPQDSGRVSVYEGIGQLSEANKKYCILENPQLCSRSFFAEETAPRILQIETDEEIQGDLISCNQTDAGPIEASGPTFTVNTPTEPRAARSLLTGLSGTLIPPLRRKAGDDSLTLLPDSSDSSATSKLLSSFMELRHSKRPRLSKERSSSDTGQATTVDARSQTELPPSVEDDSCELTKAPAPEFREPEVKCHFIVSLGLSRSLLTRLEKSYPGFELIDRDFTQYNSVAWSPGSARRQTCISPLSYEADICLSPSTGIIITTLLNVKQKPLPGSTTATPLRDRIQRVSEKYEALFILVSEANVTGEYVGNIGASDLAAYADFTHFTASIQAGITTFLVPGAEETLAKWVLSLMEKSAGHAASFRHCLQPRDTTWEMLFRWAGMNIFAAQTLGEVLLAEYGNIGLTRFLTMATEERVARFGQMMGGERVLRTVCKVLDLEWI